MSCRAPISWLALERHAAGDLPTDARTSVDAHLAECMDCKRVLDTIAADARPMRSLARRRRPWLGIASALALAALLLFAIGRRPRADETTVVKGEDLAFGLVGDDGVVVHDTGTFRDGERFKALVTCPPEVRASFDLVVYEEGATPVFPLEPAVDHPCGNGAPLPGAFRVTGQRPLRVCLARDDGRAVDRESLRQLPPPNARCVELRPTP